MLLPPCCSSGCTVCVLDYPDQYAGVTDPDLAAMLDELEKLDHPTVEIEENR